MLLGPGPQIPSPKSRQNCKQPPPQPSPTTPHKYNLYQSMGNQQPSQVIIGIKWAMPTRIINIFLILLTGTTLSSTYSEAISKLSTQFEFNTEQRI